MRRTPDDIQDEWLVLRAQEGDAEAFSSLVVRWQPRLSAFAWRLTGEREAVGDVVQDAWTAIVRGLPRLVDPAAFRTWAYRVVRNLCADRTRRRVVARRKDRTLRVSSPASWDEAASDGPSRSNDDLHYVREAIARLPGDQRVALSLHYLEGMSIAEVAEVLDVPEGTVKSRLHHARSALKRILERVKR